MRNTMQKRKALNKSYAAVPAAILSCALTISATALQSQPAYDQAIAAYRQGNHELAFNMIDQHADEVGSKGQLLLSSMYRNGIGTEADEYEGFKWCKIAAESGLAEAQYQLGMMYLSGEGVTEDDDIALRWLSAASAQGYEAADQIIEFMMTDDFGFGC